MITKPYTFDRVVRMLIGLTVLFLLFLLITRLSGVLLPFLAAWFIAYLLQPIVRFFQYKLKLRSRVLSIFLTLTLVLSILVGIVWVLAPMIVSEFSKLSSLIVSNASALDVNSFIPLAWQQEISSYFSHLNLQTILRDENIMGGLKKVAPQLWDLLNGSLDLVLSMTVFVVGFLYLIFILVDFENIGASWITIIPPKYRSLVIEITKDLENGMNRYFRGQALVAFIVGCLFAIGFSIIGLPLSIVMGVLIGLVTMVPYLKVVLVLPCLMLGWLQALENGQSYGSVLIGIALVFIIIQIIEDVLLVPKIMGHITGLNPAVILLSLSIWGSLMGVVGMIIALPMTTLILSYYKRFVIKEMPATEILTGTTAQTKEIIEEDI